MAGRRRTRELFEELERRARQEFDWDATGGEPPPTALDFVESWVKSGRTMTALAAVLEEDGRAGGEVTRERLSRALFGRWGEESTARLSRARFVGAHGMAEGAMELIEQSDTDSITVDRERAKVRQWLAEKWSPTEFGRQQQVNVAISFGDSHLAALRSRQLARQNLQQIETVPMTVLESTLGEQGQLVAGQEDSE